MLEPVQRSAASKKAVHQRNIRGALNRVSEAPGQYILVAPQPLQSCPCLDALAATRRSSSRVMIATAIRRDAACSWTGPSPVSHRLPLPSSARHAKCRLTHVRPCLWHNGSFACQPRLRRAFSAPLAPSLMLLLLSPRKWLRVASLRRLSKLSSTSLRATSRGRTAPSPTPMPATPTKPPAPPPTPLTRRNRDVGGCLPYSLRTRWHSRRRHCQLRPLLGHHTANLHRAGRTRLLDRGHHCRRQH